MGEAGTSADMETAKLNAATYLVKQRGIHPDTIEQYSLGVTESEEIAIPLMDRNGNRTGTLYRSIREEDGQRYRQQGGTALFGIPQALRRMQSGQDTLYVVEGPFDAMSIHQEGYPAVAVMAATLTRKQVREIREVFGDVQVVLLLDNDMAGWKAAKANRRMLEEAGFAVKTGKLPAGYKDANEYLAEKFHRRYLSVSHADNTENTENNTA